MNFHLCSIGILLCGLLLGRGPLFAQERARIHGSVTDAGTGEPVPGATILLTETSLGTASDAAGNFSLDGVPLGRYELRVTMIGYEAYDTTLSVSGAAVELGIALTEAHAEVEEVVVTGTRTVRSIADVPVRIEAIPAEEVEERMLMTPSNVAMLLNESTGMRVQTTSAASSSANLRIQGLSGRYTQLLTDGIPNFGGLSAGFGLTQLAPLHLRQVEVVKGATSALYGADAISGVVNFLTRDPRRGRPEVSLLTNATTQGGIDLAGYYGSMIGDRAGMTVMAGRNTQPRHDVDGDGFADVAEFQRTVVSPKFTYSFGEGDEPAPDLRVASTYTDEHRAGGAADDGSMLSVPYLETIDTRRFDLSGRITVPLEGHDVAVNGAFMNLERDAIYAGSPFAGRQQMFYADAQDVITPLPLHTVLLGVSYAAERFRDRSPGISASRSYDFSVPGLFVQDEWTIADAWRMVAGIRVDRHNRYGTVVTPRVSVMHRPSERLTLRLGGGTGFKAPTFFVEEAEEIGFRNIRPAPLLRREDARSLSLDANWNTLLPGEIALTVNAALYGTIIDNALTADDDSLAAGVLALRNVSGQTVTRGAEMTAKVIFGELKLSAGYTFLYATQEDRGAIRELPYNPRHSLGLVLVWESEEAGAKAGWETYWTGRQRLERNPYRSVSADYWIAGFIAEKRFGAVRVFVNFENIFDLRQTQFDPLFYRLPGQGGIRPLPAYAPLEGRVINGGIRLVLGQE